MDRKQQMVRMSKSEGRRTLYPYIHGSITGILGYESYNDAERLSEIRQLMADFEEVWNDESLPYTWDEAQKARKEESHAENQSPRNPA